MKLYHFPLSPYSHKVQLGLLVKGLEYNSQSINPLNDEGQRLVRQEYPIGKLPLLKVGEKLIPESSVIVEYLDEVAPEILLIPNNKGDAREVRLKDRLADFYISANAITLFFMNLKPEGERDQNTIKRCLNQIRGCYQVIESMLEKNNVDERYFHGDRLTMADLSLLPALRISRRMISFEEFPKISSYYDEHSQMQSFKTIDIQAKTALTEIMASLNA